jgi:hypothetical protein
MLRHSRSRNAGKSRLRKIIQYKNDTPFIQLLQLRFHSVITRPIQLLILQILPDRPQSTTNAPFAPYQAIKKAIDKTPGISYSAHTLKSKTTEVHLLLQTPRTN